MASFTAIIATMEVNGLKRFASEGFALSASSTRQATMSL
jgi:hypothetical protein